MQIMPGRTLTLQQTVAGYEETEMPLVAFDGVELTPAGFSDDVGIYELIPRLARLLDIPIERAIDLFFAGVVVIAFAVGVFGYQRYFKSAILQAWAAAMLAVIAILCLADSDVYVVPACIAMAIVPWHLHWLRDRSQASTATYVVAGLAGLALGTAQYLRIHSATALMIFVVISMVPSLRRAESWRLRPILVVLAGILVAAGYFNIQLARRDAYLAAEVADYEAPLKRHPTWHSIYIGLGYVRNDHGISYLDTVASARVIELNPDAGYLTAEYEATLRQEVLRIARADPSLVARNVYWKARTLAGWLLWVANVGLLAAAIALRRKALWIHCAFAAALGFSALPGMLVIPRTDYVLGFIAFAALYGLTGLELAIESTLPIRRARSAD